MRKPAALIYAQFGRKKEKKRFIAFPTREFQKPAFPGLGGKGGVTILHLDTEKKRTVLFCVLA